MRRPTSRVVAFAAAALAIAAVSGTWAQRQALDTEWKHFNNDVAGTKYSPLAMIDRDNVRNLQVQWRWPSPDREIEVRDPMWRATKYEDTPLLIKGTLYTITTLGVVAAIDPATGRTLWSYDPESYKQLKNRPPDGNLSNRGLEYWTDGKQERLLAGTIDGTLLSIDPKTHKPDPRFGLDGVVDLTDTIPHAIRGNNYMARRPVVAGDVIIVGSVPAGGVYDAPPGDVQAFDVRTGKLLWTFHTIPRRGEFGYESWLDHSADRAGKANVWAGITYDPKLGYVYLASSPPTSDYYGAARPGDNLFADTLLCLDARTGKRVWHYQVVHHDLWDYDLPADPVLGDITVDGKPIKAVMLTSKQAFTYVFDRKTGVPVWPIVERAVPQSTVPGERSAATQPHPTKPPAFDLQGTGPENLIDFTPELRATALERLKKFELGPVFSPPSLRGTVVLPGVYGGGRWGGGAWDPETGWLYVPSITVPSVGRFVRPGAPRNPAPGEPSVGNAQDLLIDGLPIFKPPYSRVSAIDMNKGEIRWFSPLGDGPRHHPLLKGLNVGPLGTSPQMTHVLLTRTLLFVTVTYMNSPGAVSRVPWAASASPDLYKELMFVFDKRTGEWLHTVKLDGEGLAQPMTYVHQGRQFILTAAGGKDTAELVALSIGRP